MTTLKRIAVALILSLASLALTAGPATAHRTPKPVTNERQIAVVGFVPGASQAAVMRDWSASPYVRLFPAASCAGHQHCVVVSQEPMGPGQGGYAAPTSHLGYGIAVVNSDLRGERLRRQVLCHEIGHTLYVDHGRGCTVERSTGRNTRPGGHNLNAAR